MNILGAVSGIVTQALDPASSLLAILQGASGTAPRSSAGLGGMLGSFLGGGEAASVGSEALGQLATIAGSLA
jgi:hypothetical protein